MPLYLKSHETRHHDAAGRGIFNYAQAPGPIALRGARIVTVSGPVLEKGTVLLRNGLIEAVGENIDVPKDAWVVDAQGITVYPGLIDALSTVGLPETPATTPRAEAGAAPATPRFGGKIFLCRWSKVRSSGPSPRLGCARPIS
jgi:hypothetical protein